MRDEVPVFQTRVECPVCKTVNEHETIKVGAYTESGSDSDFCPTGRKWRNPKYQHLSPLLYFMATCSACFYTREFNKNFKEWKNDNQFRTYRQKAIRTAHLNALAQPDSVVKALAEGLDPEQCPSETAIVKLLIGIFDEMLLDRPSELDLGRWYLRIGWLYRELGSERPARASADSILEHKLAPALRRLRENFTEGRTQVDSIRALLASPEDVGGSTLPAIGTQCQQEAVRWGEQLSGLRDSIDALLSMPGGRENASSSTGSAAVVGEYASFADFMLAVHRLGDWVPLDEGEALSKALTHYERAFRDGTQVSGGNQQIQVAYMVGELARRIGEHHQADEFFRVALKSGHELIHKHNHDKSRTALARRIVELATEQSRQNRDALAQAQ